MNKKHGIRLWAVLFWLCVWQAASMALGSELLLVSPVRVILRLSEMVREAQFWRAILFTLMRIALGFLLAWLSGCLLASLSSFLRPVRDLLSPLMLAIRTVPVASFIILALIWLPSRNLSVLISFLMVLPILYTNVLDGILSVDNKLLEMAQVFRVTPVRRVRYIYLPQVMPFMLTGCRVGLGLCWKAGVAAEVIGMPRGSIGERLQQAKVYLDTPDMFAWTLVIVLASVCFERLVLWLLKAAARRIGRG
ncbi:MAG: ABC transporter permease subunit [Clostridia bacterium]|nr:ABC transporter permease subunit [Clostridia bacterium]